jgi:predicted lipid-binding transport protein (Tim44 family)
MRRRGNKPVSIAAKIIFLLIVLMIGVVIWSGIRGLQKEPRGPPRGSQSMPAQAAQGTARSVTPEVQPTR